MVRRRARIGLAGLLRTVVDVDHVVQAVPVLVAGGQPPVDDDHQCFVPPDVSTETIRFEGDGDPAVLLLTGPAVGVDVVLVVDARVRRGGAIGDGHPVAAEHITVTTGVVDDRRFVDVAGGGAVETDPPDDVGVGLTDRAALAAPLEVARRGLLEQTRGQGAAAAVTALKVQLIVTGSGLALPVDAEVRIPGDIAVSLDVVRQREPGGLSVPCHTGDVLTGGRVEPERGERLLASDGFGDLQGEVVAGSRALLDRPVEGDRGDPAEAAFEDTVVGHVDTLAPGEVRERAGAGLLREGRLPVPLEHGEHGHEERDAECSGQRATRCTADPPTTAVPDTGRIDSDAHRSLPADAGDALISARGGRREQQIRRRVAGLVSPGSMTFHPSGKFDFQFFTHVVPESTFVKPPRPGGSRDPKHDETPCENGETMRLAPLMTTDASHDGAVDRDHGSPLGDGTW